MTDAVSTAAVGNRAQNDSAALTDASGAVQGVIRSVADSIGLTDAIQAVKNAARAITDAIGITDSVTARFTAGIRDLTFRATPLGPSYTVQALLPVWATDPAPETRYTAEPLPGYDIEPLTARWAIGLLPGGTMTTEIIVSAGAAKYVGGTVTETTGKDISGATFEISLGSVDAPGRTWLTPDVSVQGSTTAERTIKLLVTATVPSGIDWPGTFYAWVRITDTPEIEPLRVQGPITIR
jgi:hypothetical protein